ncbi:hypothetical protein MASR2M47_39650 [Draconibacterium sp.]|jgi:hypothetical protein
MTFGAKKCGGIRALVFNSNFNKFIKKVLAVMLGLFFDDREMMFKKLRQDFIIDK